MRVLPTALILVPLAAGAALAEPGPFDGRWGWDAAACAIGPGEGDGVPIEIGDGAIRYYESECSIDRVVPLGNGSGPAWTVTTTCSGEGETWTSESVFAIEDRGGDTPRRLIELDMEAGFVVVREDCGAVR